METQTQNRRSNVTQSGYTGRTCGRICATFLLVNSLIGSDDTVYLIRARTSASIVRGDLHQAQNENNNNTQAVPASATPLATLLLPPPQSGCTLKGAQAGNRPSRSLSFQRTTARGRRQHGAKETQSDTALIWTARAEADKSASVHTRALAQGSPVDQKQRGRVCV